MKNKFLILFLFCLISFANFAQNEFLGYRSFSNPFYWKNKKPYEGYWQQDVHYSIQAELDDSLDIVSGVENLTYWNNSPDTLFHVFFHLYSNANAKGSYLEDLYKNNNIKIGRAHV